MNLLPSPQDLVRAWHQKYGVKINSGPTLLDERTARLRIDLIQEEVREIRQSYWKYDPRLSKYVYLPSLVKSTEDGIRCLAKTADALGDTLYVIYGTGVTMGIDLDPIFREINSSNMSKTIGIMRDDGKILKGPNWKPPDLERLIEIQQKNWKLVY